MEMLDTHTHTHTHTYNPAVPWRCWTGRTSSIATIAVACKRPRNACSSRRHPSASSCTSSASST
eukprot:288100-Pelagomonas_calceolata.AAC.1